jgi:hypothetical protein
MNLALDLDIHRNSRVVRQPTGIDKPESSSIPLGTRKVTVTRGSCLIAYDRGSFSNNPVEES